METKFFNVQNSKRCVGALVRKRVQDRGRRRQVSSLLAGILLTHRLQYSSRQIAVFSLSARKARGKTGEICHCRQNALFRAVCKS